MNTDTGEVRTGFTGYSCPKCGEPEREKEMQPHRCPRKPVVSVWKPIDEANLSAQNRAQLADTGRTQISRNSRCPCGSNKRFKKCCYTGGS